MYADLQVNGYLGVDFSNPELSPEEFRRAAGALLETGTVVFLPTLITAPLPMYRRNIALIQSVVAQEGWESNIPGVHLEGPFISPEPGAVGCHHPEWVLPPDPAVLDTLGDFVRMLTVAAERPGMEDLIRAATKRGIIVSLGHQLASSADLERAAAAGAQTLTHLGNGIPNQIDRHRNAIWSGLACDALTAMIITDGHHLPPEVIRCFLRCKGIDKVIVTSDASPGAGLPPGHYHLLGNDVVLEPDGKLHNPAKGCLAGSASTMRECMRYLASLDWLTAEELHQVGYANAVRLLEKNKRK